MKLPRLNEEKLAMIFGFMTVILIGLLVFRMYNRSETTDRRVDCEWYSDMPIKDVPIRCYHYFGLEK